MMNTYPNFKKGFTLIELMIVVAIIAILVGIAYPAYNDYLIKANRSAAKSFILELANKQEIYLSDNRQYAINGNDGNKYNLNIVTPDEVSRYYTVTIGPNAATVPPTYVIRATPKNNTRQSNDGYIELDNTGKKTSQFPNKW